MKIKSIIIAMVTIAVPALIIAAVPSMSLGYLTGGPFRFSDREIVFQKNGTYTHAQREYSDEGTFAITGDTVTLTPRECHENVPGVPMKKSPKVQCPPDMAMSCSIKEAPGDLYYEHYLVCGTSKYHSGGAVKSGSERNYKGVPVVTMGMAKGVTTSSVKIRETPSVTGRALTYIDEPYGPRAAPTSVPDKTPITIIARTRDKEKVQSWENYWYLVNVGMFTREVWMFGEFVRMN